MKKNLILLISALLILNTYSSQAQNSRTNARIKSLEIALTRAEKKVIDCKVKIDEADSLISYGDKKMTEADVAFFNLATEVKTANKVFRSEKKRLEKLSRSKNREVAMQARTDLQKLMKSQQLAMRDFSARSRDIRKMAMQGEMDIKKGQSLQERAFKTLKISERTLRDTRARYETANSSFGKS